MSERGEVLGTSTGIGPGPDKTGGRKREGCREDVGRLGQAMSAPTGHAQQAHVERCCEGGGKDEGATRLALGRWLGPPDRFNN